MAVALALAALCALAAPAWAQSPAGKVPRLGYLWLGTPGSEGRSIEGLRHGLRELGYVEGQNLVIEYRYANGSLERLRELAAELIRLDVAVILSPGTLVTIAVKQATTSIPVVSTSGDPVGSGFVQRLARPGGNITGLSLGDDEGTAGKRIQLLREALPRATRFGMLVGPTNPLQRRIVGATQDAASQLGLTIEVARAEHPGGLSGAFSALTRARVEAVLIGGSAALLSQRREIVELAARHRLPALYSARDYVEAGGFMTYSPSVHELWQRSARYVDRILKGAKPAELPVEQPTRFELIVSLKAAREIGLTLPRAFLLRADHVLE